MPIGPSEAEYMYNSSGAVHWLMHLSSQYPRIPFLLISTANFLLFFYLTKYYLSTLKDRLIALSTFVLLPGIISSAILSDQSSLGIFATLLFLIAYKKENLHFQIASLILLVTVHQASIFLLFALIIYASYKKNGKLLVASIVLFAVGLYLNDFTIGGKPKGHFLELFALYSVVFSPFVYLYFLYAIYRRVSESDDDVLVFISGISILLSFLLSFRQYIHIEDFAPFVVIATVLMIKTFSRSYHIRLKPFRKNYRIGFFILYVTLVLNSFLLLNHTFLLNFIQPKSHFAYKFYEAGALASQLKQKQISCIDADSPKLQNQLKFYGIEYCSEYVLHSFKKTHDFELELTYKNHYIDTVYVSKVNTF
jgi:hypothetical protein